MVSESGVKHLNPRQGITTLTPEEVSFVIDTVYTSVKHLNPRQGITTPPSAWSTPTNVGLMSVKHLNPRQGITTGTVSHCISEGVPMSVKHLNPRQGITTRCPLEEGQLVPDLFCV